MIIKRNGSRLNSRHVFKHADNSRIIMAQYIKFYKTAFNGMIVEMGRYNTAVFFISRILDGRKMMNIYIARNNHYSSGMLSRSIFNSRTTVNKTVDIRIVRRNAASLRPFLNIAVSRLILYGTDSPGTKYIIFTEKFFRILMSLRMIFPRKVQIDIGYLIALKTQENSKRNIMSVLFHRRAAFGTIFVRQVKPAGNGSVRKELTVTTRRAYIMRRQRVYFRNIRHGCYKGRTYGSS